jgi:hypothetical protein
MHHPDLRHHARDRIVAAEVMALHEVRALACASRQSPTLRRVGRSGQAPEDAALYLCRCGRSFMAAVTTCVACPSCGTGQPW